jgi:hypothetical protein
MQITYLEHQFVPFGDDVGDWASRIRLTERYTTIHATSGLIFELILIETLRKLLPVTGSSLGAAVLLRATLVLHETLGLVEDKSGALLLSLAVSDTFLDVEKIILLLVVLSIVLLLLRVLLKRATSIAGHDGERVLSLLGFGGLLGLLQHDALVVSGQNLDEAVQGTREVEKNTGSKLGSSVMVVVLNETANESDLSRVLETRKLNHLLVDLTLEVTLHVKNIGDTTRHTGSEVSAGRSENENTTTSHVLATVVTNTLDDSSGTGVSDSETLSTHTTEEGLTAGSTVKTSVTNDDVLLSLEDCVSGRVDDQTTTGKTLADVVIAVALELKSNTRCKESTEGLTSRTTDIGMDGVGRQTPLTVALADLVRESSTKSTISVDNITLNAARVALLESQLRFRDELVVKTDVKLVVLLTNIVGCDTRTEGVCRCQDERKINVLSLCVTKVVTNAQNLSTTNHLVDGAETKLGHDGTKLVGDVVEEVDDVLGSTLELASQLGILGSDTDGASVQVAFSVMRVSKSSSGIICSASRLPDSAMHA